MTTLRELIARRMVGEAMSLDDVVVKAQKRGEKLGRSNLHKLTRDAPLSLTAATIRGLAAGLGVTPLSVSNGRSRVNGDRYPAGRDHRLSAHHRH